VVGDVIVKFV